MKTVMITGAAGFLGSHLSRHYLNKGDKVIGIDNFSSSNPQSLHLAELKKYEYFTFNCGNIIYPSTFDNVKEVDLILNFACPASPPIYQSIPIDTMMTCVVGLKNVLDLAMRHGAIVVQASTSEVYGEPDHTPQSESYKGNVNSYGKRSNYDEGKRAGEALCYDYLNTHNVDARLVRIFNTYGPHMDQNDGRVVSNFICQVLRNESLTIYGEGKQSRSFCYVDDLIRGIVAMGELKENPRTPINLGNPFEFTIRELAEKVVNRISNCIPSRGLPKLFEHKPMPSDDPTQRCPDITLARNILDWEPKVMLNEGLDETIEYFESLVC